MLAARILPVVLSLSLLACSGASTPEILISDTAPAEPAPSASSASSSPPSSASGSDAADAAAPTVKKKDEDDDDPAPPPPPPPPPAPTCAVEVEGNDAAAQATTFTSCIAGTVASSTDNDFLRIAAPANAHVMLVTHTETGGKLLYRVSEEGGLPFIGPSIAFTGAAPAIEVTPGAAYLIRVTFPTNSNGNSKGDRAYALTATFQ